MLLNLYKVKHGDANKFIMFEPDYSILVLSFCKDYTYYKCTLCRYLCNNGCCSALVHEKLSNGNSNMVRPRDDIITYLVMDQLAYQLFQQL